MCHYHNEFFCFQSLVVFDQEPMQQKLSSANSVNSIVSHVAKTIEQEEVGRVAGWAVRFEKLLQDSIGIKVFTVSQVGSFILCCKYLHKSYIKLKYEDEKRIFTFPLSYNLILRSYCFYNELLKAI